MALDNYDYLGAPGQAGGGTLTSVGLADGSTTPVFGITGSPVTNNGTLTFTALPEAANTFWAGPGSGASAQPTFRTIELLDLAPSTAGSTANYVLTSNGAAVAPSYKAVPAGITGSGVTNRLAIWSSSSGLTSDQNLEYTSFGTPTFSVGKTPSNSGATGNGVLETHTLALTDNAGAYLISLSAPASLGGSYTLTMPGVQGSNGNTFINDGTGGLTWGAPVGTVPQFVNTAGGTSANITVGVVNYFYQVAGGSGNATFALPSNNAGSSNMLFTVINSNVGSVILSIPSGVTVLLPSGVALTGPATYTGSTSYCAITLVSVQFSNSYNIISQTGSWS